MRRRSAAFTLVEMLCAVVIIGILISLFYSTFLSSWSAMDNYAVRANLWQDMNKVMDKVTIHARQAKTITVATDKRSVIFLDSSAAILASFDFNAAGILTMTIPGTPAVVEMLTDRVDAVASSFEEDDNSLVVKLVLADNVAARRVQIETSTEIFARN